ncbi:MAG: MATE family efflux transporter [Lachnospiraceae bacterium]|nr:MATE family efflux transporter [Lachnospiraceae bacterium]
MSKTENKLTEGAVTKTLIVFSLPFIGSFLLQALYSVVDLLIVSHFAGTYSISGLNIVAQLTDMVLGFAIGFLSGATVLIAQYLGAGKKEDMLKTIQTSFTFILILGVIVTGIMLVLVHPVLNLLQTPTESYQEAYRYYVVVMAGVIFIFMYNAIASILRGMGDSKHPMLFVLIATVSNIILDLVFVGRFQMGAGGAALATVIAQALSVFISVIYLKKIDFPFDFRLSSFRIDRKTLRNLMRLGIPSAFQDTILNVSLVFLIGMANILGVYASAAVGIAAKINVIFILPNVALHSSLATIVGQNVGAGKLERGVKTARLEFLISAGYSLVICVIMWFFSKELLQIFTNDPNTLQVGAQYFKGHCWDYFVVMPLAYCLGGLYIGTGHTMYVAIANLCGAVISRMPLAYVLSQLASFGVLGIGIAYPISTTVTVAVYLIFLFMGKWKESTVEELRKN